jgi:hypothetical protein
MAAMYLGVSAAELDQNQITDYLKRSCSRGSPRSAASSARTSSATARSQCASG